MCNSNRPIKRMMRQNTLRHLFFFNDTATTEIYTLSLHDALPISHWRNALGAFEMALRLLHPIMPFLTEELWQRLGTSLLKRTLSIGLAPLPQDLRDPPVLAAESEIQLLPHIVRAERDLRAVPQTGPNLPLWS